MSIPRRTVLATPAALAAGGSSKLRQSLAYWCLASGEWKWDLERICRTAKELGCASVELTGAEQWPTIKKHGLTCAITGNGMPAPAFAKGVNNTRYHEEVIARTKHSIDLAADNAVPNVIAFTGYKWANADDPKSGEISLTQGAENSVKALKELGAYAASKRVTVCLEQLNTRDSSHPMKGHPGYQGDDIDYCADVVRRTGSPNVKLLFDIYHVQIMNGDVIRRVRQHAPLIGHVHTAGVPGRGEMDDRQELQYTPIIRALYDSGYRGFVGHEFIPTREPGAGLKQAIALCTV